MNETVPCTCVSKLEFPPRKFMVCSNWKMNGDKEWIKYVFKILKQEPLDCDVEIIIAVPFIYLEHVQGKCIPGNVQFAAQNCYKEACGDFTGEISAPMLKNLGIHWVILGASERRILYHETDDIIGDKCKMAIESKMKVILCVGETLAQKERGRTMEVIERQLKAVLDRMPCDYWCQVVIVYEPIWERNTIHTATPSLIEEIHWAIRVWILKNLNYSVASALRILYGGMVTAENCKQFAAKANIDGFLIDRLCFHPDFRTICNVNLNI